MSQENVEIVRRGYESWNRDDMETGLRDLDPEIEWRPRLGTAGVRATVYHGHEGVLAYKREVRGGARPDPSRRTAVETRRCQRARPYPSRRTRFGERCKGRGRGLSPLDHARGQRHWFHDLRALGADEAIEAAGLK